MRDTQTADECFTDKTQSVEINYHYIYDKRRVRQTVSAVADTETLCYRTGTPKKF